MKEKINIKHLFKDTVTPLSITEALKEALPSHLHPQNRKFITIDFYMTTKFTPTNFYKKITTIV